jgi:hypothetical protein
MAQFPLCIYYIQGIFVSEYINHLSRDKKQKNTTSSFKQQTYRETFQANVSKTAKGPAQVSASPAEHLR